jgi:hypothetical protein
VPVLRCEHGGTASFGLARGALSAPIDYDCIGSGTDRYT